MYVILVYDIGEKRVTRVLKACRAYLNWVQNSVFEGEISEAKLEELKLRLKKIMKEKEDAVLIYRLGDQRYMKKEVLGQEKSPLDTFL
ncbi:MAG: CRISPR-associated endonuclease Cas2 [Calditrichaeota bacterium]|nr:MAG: CRISPR-associated endonuclease Cas2 [Calditrichota bacterium]